jgi:hypothetical protein
MWAHASCATQKMCLKRIATERQSEHKEAKVEESKFEKSKMKGAHWPFLPLSNHSDLESQSLQTQSRRMTVRLRELRVIEFRPSAFAPRTVVSIRLLVYPSEVLVRHGSRIDNVLVITVWRSLFWASLGHLNSATRLRLRVKLMS